MKALTWHGKGDMRCESVPDPKIEHPRDAIIKVTACAICGSDLHILRRRDPQHAARRRARARDDGRGGRGRAREQQAEGRRPCRRAVHHRLRRMLLLQARLFLGLRALQSRTQRRRRSCGAIRPPACSATRICSAAIAGGQAEYLRVPFADVGPIKVPDSLSDEQVLFLSDIFPTGYMAAEFCDIQGGDTIAVWGCGPVGQFAIRSAFLLGAERVIAIDTVPERLAACAARPARHHRLHAKRTSTTAFRS